ncbi:MAG: hypothetical protein MJH10_03730 [Epibacterium sp.]|nr:hypothetical protein [Epibacterium sp.]NQX72667.1 hypothetical protein [Epibacterium sp.]
MSDTDSFIEEVTEEVRRDRLFMLLRRYGWIGVAGVLLIVGGATWREIQRSSALEAAQVLGDQMSSALEENGAEDRATALAEIQAAGPAAEALLRMAEAGALVEAGNKAAAADMLKALASNGELDQVYRDLAAFKALGLQAESLSVDERRIAYEALARPGAPLYLLSLEQLALLEIETGEIDAALARLREISLSAGVSRDLQDRVRQVIVALGGALESGTDGDVFQDG